MYYWIWTYGAEGLEVNGPFSSYTLAQAYGDNNIETEFEIGSFPTRNKGEATSLIEAGPKEETLDLSGYRLQARRGEEGQIPKYGLEADSRSFDLDSLIRMYGEEEVRKFLQDKGV